MKYLIIYTRKNCGDEFVEEFNDREEAIREAQHEWDRYINKKDATSFYVLESVNPDEDAEDHYDGKTVIDFLEEA